MGSVYLAEDDLGNPVAVKVIHEGRSGAIGIRTRFRREVAAAFRVDSPWMPRVLAADADAPEPYLVTEFVDGPTLAERVERDGPLDPIALRTFARHLAEALIAVHRVGLVHRDVKPSNVLVTPAGPMLIDLGIAYALESDDTATRAGTAIGTRSWMSPEQARGQTVGPATDVFGWAATIAFAATGRPPFGSGPADAVLYRVVHEPPDTEGLDGDVGGWVNTALRTDPAARPDLDEIVAALADGAPSPPARFPTEPTRLLGGGAAGLPGPLDATERLADQDSTAPADPIAATPTPSRRRAHRRAALVVFVAVLAGLAGLAGFAAYRATTDSSDAPTGRTPASTSARVEPTTAPTDPTDPPSTATTVVSEVPITPVTPTDPGTDPRTDKGRPDKAKGPKADR